MRRPLLSLLLIAACDPEPDPDAPFDTAADTDADTDTDTDTDTDADTDTDVDTDSDADTGVDPAAAVCARWRDVRATLVTGGWTGDVGTCDAGDLPASTRHSAVALWNLYRELAGHGPITTDPTRDANAQACALLQHANGFLDHSPSSTAACYSSAGASAAGTSNLAGAEAVSAIDLYMVDPGNETTLGHRRWLLSNGLSAVGIGGTSDYSCHTVIGAGGGGTSRDWTAWPPPGPVPHDVWTASWVNLDSTGWSLQSDVLPLGSGTVTFTDDTGAALGIEVSSLLSGYGSTHAISMIPTGWTAEPGRSYTVEVTGLSTPIRYTVDVVDCDEI